MFKDISPLIAPHEGASTIQTPQVIPTLDEVHAFDAEMAAGSPGTGPTLGYETVSHVIGKCPILNCEGDLFLETYWENIGCSPEAPQMVPKAKCFCAGCKTQFKLPHNTDEQ